MLLSTKRGQAVRAKTDAKRDISKKPAPSIGHCSERSKTTVRLEILLSDVQQVNLAFKIPCQQTAVCRPLRKKGHR